MEAYETAEQETAGYQASVFPREAAAKQQLIALSAEGHVYNIQPSVNTSWVGRFVHNAATVIRAIDPNLTN